jgi:exonuclease SbcD
MRLLHMADVHFGKRFLASRFGEEVARRRRQALERALMMTVAYANEHDVDHILCAGDLIESAEIRPRDLRSLNDIVSGLSRAKIYLACGNHDPLNDTSPYRRANLSDRLVVLPAGYSRTMLDGETALHAFSFPEAELDVNPLASLSMDKTARRNLLLLHGDAVSADSRYLPIGADFLKKFDYCALGHLHQPLELTPHARYSGSLIGMDRNETGPRGFVLLDLNGGIRQEFVPLPIPTYESIRVALDADMGDAAAFQRVRDALSPLPADNLYSVTLTGAHAPGARPAADTLAQRLRDEGYTAYLIDETSPAYDLAELVREHRDGLIGRLIDDFGPQQDMSAEDRLALEYALAALMEGGGDK